MRTYRPSQLKEKTGDGGNRVRTHFLAWSQSILTQFLPAPTNWISATYMEKKTHKHQRIRVTDVISDLVWVVSAVLLKCARLIFSQ